jgi:hypothetical protein
VGPPSDAADLLRASQRRRAAKQINEEPEDKIKYGRNFEEKREEEDWKQDDESRRWKKYQIRTENARNRARGAYRWERRIRVCQQLRETGDAAANQIKNRKSDRSHPIFDVVAENPERPHVCDNVEPAAMQKLVREDRPVAVHRKTDRSRPIGMSEAGRHNSEKIKDLFDTLPGKHELKEKDQCIDKNQRARNYRHGAARNRVLNRKHLSTYLSHQRYQLAAPGDLQLAEDRVKMFFHRFETQEAFVGNLLIAVPIAHQMRQILFSTREPDQMGQRGAAGFDIPLRRSRVNPRTPRARYSAFASSIKQRRPRAQSV